MSTSFHEIHQSVADAENLESVHDQQISVADVFLSLVRHPTQVIARWNWKSAFLGALLRASFYFTVYQAAREKGIVILTAVLVEVSFRFMTSGISGALVQSFRKARPAWIATIIITVTLPIFSHTVEFVTHYAQEEYFSDVLPAAQNSARQQAFAVSVLVSVLSAMFNIFMMRNGVLLVGAGEDSKSFISDLRNIPYLVSEFTLFLPKQIIIFLKELKFHYAIGSFLFFGFSVGAILGASRGKWSWAYSTTIGSWAILLGAIIIVFAGQQLYRLFSRK
ncbi:MAG: hypothetical protein HKN25_08500 [Pyrinomonadaceae bacterium]|nr:hypothetical protein [Pyrinomonadaceae bacterium]